MPTLTKSSSNRLLRMMALAALLPAVLRSVYAFEPAADSAAGLEVASVATDEHKVCTVYGVGDSTMDDGCKSNGTALVCKQQGNNDWVPVAGLNHTGAPISNGLRKFLSVTAQILGCPFNNHAFASGTTGNNKQLFVNDLHPNTSVYTNCTQPGYVNKTFACVPTVYKQIVDNPPAKNATVVVNGGGNDFFNDLSALIKLLLNRLKEDSLLQTKLEDMLTDFSKLGLSSDKAVKVFESRIIAFLGDDSSSFSFPVENLRKISELLQSQYGVAKANLRFMNLPDMSQVPAALELTANPLVLKLISLISRVYNYRLERQLTNWPLSKYNLETDNIFPVDRLLGNITKDPRAYGFSPEMNTTCIDQKALPECKDASGFNLFWFNGKHLTSDADEFLGKAVAVWLRQAPS